MDFQKMFEEKESELFIEKKDLSKYSKEIASNTENNNHMGNMVIAAKIINNKTLIKLVGALETILDLEKHDPISEYKYTIYRRLMSIGKNKFGEDWKKNILDNM